MWCAEAQGSGKGWHHVKYAHLPPPLELLLSLVLVTEGLAAWSSAPAQSMAREQLLVPSHSSPRRERVGFCPHSAAPAFFVASLGTSLE